MRWDDLNVVLAVARAGTLVGAARRLKINATTVGRRLKAIEDKLGAPLFLRAPGAMVPTELCESVLLHAERVESEMLALAARVADQGATPQGTVRIATMPWIIHAVLVPALAAFRARYPGIEVELIGGARKRSLSRREADLSVRFELEPQGREDCLSVGRFPYAVYRPADAEPADLPWIGFGEDFAPVAPERWFQEHVDPGARIAMRSNDAGAVHAAIRAGIGKGLLPEFCGEGDPLLSRLSGLEPEFVRTLRVLVHRDMKEIARVSAVIDWLREIMPEPAATPDVPTSD